MSAVDLHQRNEWTVGPPDEPPPTMDNVKEELFLTRMVIGLFRNRRLDWLIIASLRILEFCDKLF